MAYISNQWRNSNNGRAYLPEYVSMSPSYNDRKFYPTNGEYGIEYSVRLESCLFKYKCSNPKCDWSTKTNVSIFNGHCESCNANLLFEEKIYNNKHMVLDFDASDISYVFSNLIKHVEIDEVFNELITNLDRFSAEQKLEIVKKILNDK